MITLRKNFVVPYIVRSTIIASLMPKAGGDSPLTIPTEAGLVTALADSGVCSRVAEKLLLGAVENCGVCCLFR